MLSGDRCFDPILASQLGLASGEVLAGFISIGTIKEAPPPAKERLSQVVLSCWFDPADAGVRPTGG
ncbi:hypothetical protein [Variovorax sp. GT1P44]|uniref:hypothetical protein n=1 Tax=Variovorax sp. GT1P44 TaxID=3443742 RepID=UPI003F44778D